MEVIDKGVRKVKDLKCIELIPCQRDKMKMRELELEGGEHEHRNIYILRSELYRYKHLCKDERAPTECDGVIGAWD